MSLFDVIKYPISDVPKQAELEALPVEIYQNWVLDVFGKSAPYEDVAEYFEILVIPSDMFQVLKLRKMIRDYNESV